MFPPRDRPPKFCFSDKYIEGAAKGGGSGLSPTAPFPPEVDSLQNTDFVDTMISNILRDFPFSLNQPL
jgi:hypothetical protein